MNSFSCPYFVVKKMFTLITMFLLLGYTSNAQQFTRIDSLQNVIDTSANDSILYKANLRCGVYWEFMDLDSTLYFYDQSFKIAEKNNWTVKQGDVFTNKAFSYFYNRNFTETFSNLDKALVFYRKAGDSAAQMNAYYNQGYFYSKIEDYRSAITYLKKSIKLAKLLQNEKILSYSYTNIGLAYQYTGQYDKANLYEFKALEIKEKNSDATIGVTYINIALNYKQQQEFAKCIEYNKKALDLFSQYNDKTNMALSLKNIGDAMLDLKSLDSANYYYDKSFLIYKNQDNREAIAEYYMLKGILKKLQKKPSEAYRLFKQSLDSMPLNASRMFKLSLYSKMAGLNLDLISEKQISDRLINETIAYAKEMISIATEISSLKFKTQACLILFNAYHHQKRLDSAFFYIDKYLVLKDSLFDFEKQKIITEIQTKYETEKKELRIENLNHENELINTKLIQSNRIKKQQKIIIYLLILGFLIVLFSAFFINRYYSFIKKTNLTLKEQNQIISEQNKENKELLKELHHRIKNNLQIISSLLDLQIKTTDHEDTRHILLDSLSRIKSVGLIHQLLNHKKDVSSVNLKELVVKLSDHITLYAGKSPVSTDIDIDQELSMGIETTLPLSLIITELLTNAFKYAFKNTENGKICICIKETIGNKYLLELSDNGPGLPNEPDFNKSLGLRLAKTLGHQLSGELIYEYDNGAKFTLEFTRKKRHG